MHFIEVDEMRFKKGLNTLIFYKINFVETKAIIAKAKGAFIILEN